VKIQLRREDGFQFTAEGPSDYPIRIASGAGEGERPEGVGSMEMVAMGLAGCSSTDIVLILGKQNQTIEDYRVELDAKRAEEETPAVFRDLHLHVHIEGDVAPQKAQRAVELSLEKYCSVAHMLRETAEIRYSLTVNGEEVARHADYG
jgi:putative redox protein